MIDVGGPPTFTTDQREAVIRYVLDAGHKPADAVRAAARGKLGRHGPFTISISSVREWAARERRSRRG